MDTSHQLQTLTASELEQVEGGMLLIDAVNALIGVARAVAKGAELIASQVLTPNPV